MSKGEDVSGKEIPSIDSSFFLQWTNTRTRTPVVFATVIKNTTANAHGAFKHSSCYNVLDGINANGGKFSFDAMMAFASRACQ